MAETPTTKNAKPAGYKKYKGTVVWERTEINLMEKMEIRDDDIFVVTYPRSVTDLRSAVFDFIIGLTICFGFLIVYYLKGTALTQELTYLVATEDFETVKCVQLDDRFPVMDLNDLSESPYYRGIKYLEELPRSSRRFIKSHMHYFLLPEALRQGKGKVIYIARNPKDAVLSMYKLLKHLSLLKPGTNLGEYVANFLNGESTIGDPWWTHVKSAWNHRNDENFLFLKFEDVSIDKATAARKIAAHLGKSLSEETIQKIADHCSVDQMKENDFVNMSYLEELRETDDSFGRVINKGKTGTWKEGLSEEQSRQIDEMIARELEGTGLTLADK